MAAEQLLGQAANHDLRHDLESVFWLIVWVCTLYGDPANIQDQSDSIQPPLKMPNHADKGSTRPGLSGSLARITDNVAKTVLNWNKSAAVSGGMKVGVLWAPSSIFGPYVAEIDPYWAPLATDGGTLYKLLEAIKSIKDMKDEQATEQYELLLGALDHGLKVLEEAHRRDGIVTSLC